MKIISNYVSDRFTSLPQPIIENILCLVPIKDAVRTSILSRDWRYNWAQIPILVFNEKDMFDESNDIKEEGKSNFEERRCKKKHLTKRHKFFGAIHQVLLTHHGPILKFSLAMEADETCFEIVQIISYLSRNNTLNKFKLDLDCTNTRYSLPLSLFSLHQLTHLYLKQCDLPDHQPTSNGFGRLTSLSLNNVETTIETVLNLVSKSPLLKSFSLVILEFVTAYNHDSVYRLFRYLPRIEHMCFHVLSWHFTTTEFNYREFPTRLVHLKYAELADNCFVGKHGLPFAVILIRSSPNLENLRLLTFLSSDEKSEVDPVVLEKYTDIWLEHLKELEIDVANRVPELDFVKLVMAKSPVLKKVRVLLLSGVGNDEELEMLAVVLHCPRASQMVEIVVKRLSEDLSYIYVSCEYKSTQTTEKPPLD